MDPIQEHHPHGRKGGRGLRPWLLIPKVICVAVFLGSYSSATLLWFYFRGGASAGTLWPIEGVSLIFRWLVIPSLSATLLFGGLLLLQYPGVFIRRRWLQVKLLLVAVLLPILHFAARRAFLEVKRGFLDDGLPFDHAAMQSPCLRFSVLLPAGLLTILLLVFMGRYKPRLDQTPQPLRRRS